MPVLPFAIVVPTPDLVEASLSMRRQQRATAAHGDGTIIDLGPFPLVVPVAPGMADAEADRRNAALLTESYRTIVQFVPD